MNCRSVRMTLRRIGDNGMKPNLTQMGISNVGIALCVIAVGAGAGLDAATGSQIPAIAGAVIGIYLLFAIRIADQWEKVAVLRFGRYLGLRGPGLFHIIPIVDR